MLAALALAAASLALAGASAQTGPSATVSELSTTPRVLPSDGGILTVEVRADTTLEDLRLRLVVEDPDGLVVHETERLALAPQAEGSMALEHDLDVDPSGTDGTWTVSPADAVTVDQGTTRSVDLDGKLGVDFLVNEHEPVGGADETPWQQAGGDPAHTGRTLAVGPDTVEVVRWTYTPEDGQALHTPRIGQDGTIYVASWDGEVQALTPDGAPLWDGPTDLPGQVSFPPALGSDGRLIVPDGAGRLVAVDADGSVDWRIGDSQQMLSTPVVGPEGRIFAIQEPWTLLQVSPTGQVLHTTELPEPPGGAPEAPAVPEPQPGPRLAVTPGGEAVALGGDGLVLVHRNGTVANARPFDCGCEPGAVSLSQDVPIALAVGTDRISAMSVRTGIEVWNVTDGDAPLDGQPWHAATVGWADQAYVTTEGGVMLNISLDDPDQVSHRRFRAPLRGQPVVDANHDVYVADACSILRSLEPDFETRWITELDTSSCNGLSSSLAITPSGNLLWPGPDGKLRLLGSNRAPVADFEAGWEDGTFRLDASNSTDPDGNRLSYAWRIGNATNAQGRVVQPDLPGPGTYDVRLTVSDGITSASTSREVTVNFPPEPRIVDASEGLHVELNASSTSDPEDDRLWYNWTVDGERRVSGPTLAFEATGPRVIDVALTVEDDEHEVRVERTVIAPHPSSWTTERVALFSGDCPSGVCAAPDAVDLVNGSLTKFHVINGADQTVDVTSPMPAVDGSPDTLRLSPGDSATLYTQPADGVGEALLVEAVGIARPATAVGANVIPAPGDVTWRVAGLDTQPHEGQASEVEVALEGSAPPRDVSLDVALVSGNETVGRATVDLEAGEPVDRSLSVPWTPGTVGERELRVTVTSQDELRATVAPDETEPQLYTVEVQEATLLHRATGFLEANGAWLAATGLVAAVAAGAALVYRRRSAEEPATDTGGSAGGVAPTDGDATVASSFMPRKVERFHVEQVLGEGGFGKTYLARDTVLEREVVLKELEHVGEGEARDLLLHEAQTAANLQHQNVVVVHDVVEEEGRLVLVMEHVPGGTLADRLGDPMPVKEALPLITDLLEGLAALHDAGVVHRDVKPSNILITPDGIAKITDFGVAANLEGDPPDEGDRFVGTPRYMAPEQLAGDPPGPQADVYGAGALLYQMVTGRHPLGLEEETPSPSSLLERAPELPAPQVPEELNRILEVALAQDPADRFEDAGAFLDALRQFGGQRTADETTRSA